MSCAPINRTSAIIPLVKECCSARWLSDSRRVEFHNLMSLPTPEGAERCERSDLYTSSYFPY